MKVTVYSTPDCVQCQTTKRTLDRFHISYDSIDLSQNPDAMELVQSLGYTQAPVVIVTHGDTTLSWSGFRLGKLEHLKTLANS
jgi:glutaredoxin-like protein NrdH